MAQIDAATAIQRANEHLSNGKPLLALRVLDRVSWVDLGWPDYWRARAQAFLLLGDYKQAASNAREGLHEDPDNLSLLTLHIQALLELHELDKAQHALLHALRLAPHDLELQGLADALELRMEQRNMERSSLPVNPVQTIPDTPAHARNDWRTAKDWRSGRPLFSEADANSIKRAFNTNKPTSPGKSAGQSGSYAFLLPIGFLLLGTAFLLYWLWSNTAR